jgi:hypothetical protein
MTQRWLTWLTAALAAVWLGGLSGLMHLHVLQPPPSCP